MNQTEGEQRAEAYNQAYKRACDRWNKDLSQDFMKILAEENGGFKPLKACDPTPLGNELIDCDEWLRRRGKA